MQFGPFAKEILRKFIAGGDFSAFGLFTKETLRKITAGGKKSTFGLFTKETRRENESIVLDISFAVEGGSPPGSDSARGGGWFASYFLAERSSQSSEPVC